MMLHCRASTKTAQSRTCLLGMHCVICRSGIQRHTISYVHAWRKAGLESASMGEAAQCACISQLQDSQPTEQPLVGASWGLGIARVTSHCVWKAGRE